MYTKPQSIRPEADTKFIKPFGSDVKGNVTMGSKYVNKIIVPPEDPNIDYDKLMSATKPRSPAFEFAARQTMQDGNSMTPAKQSHSELIKVLSKDQKLKLLMHLNGDAEISKFEPINSNSINMFKTPSKSVVGNRRPQTSVGKLPTRLVETSPLRQKKPAKKNKTVIKKACLSHLVKKKDKLKAADVIGYLTQFVECANRLKDPLDDIEKIFGKIQDWKKSYGDLD